MKVAFLGTGAMGAAMATRIIEHGHTLAVFNRTPSKTLPLAERGARPAATAAECAADADVVVSMLADDAAERAVFAGPEGLAASGCTGVHVVASTIGTAAAREFADAHRERALGYLVCPVFGRPDAAAAGRLSGIAAGAPRALEAARPVIECYTHQIFDLGEDPARASLAKLAGNFTLMAMIETLGEALALAEKGGIGRSTMADILTTTLYPGPVHRNYASLIAEHRYHPAGFAARLGLKDARLALAAGEELGVPLPLASLVRDALIELLARGRGDADWAAAAALPAERAGLLPSSPEHGS